jgi:hypothetical protein
MTDLSAERQFQNDIIDQLVANGWQLGDAAQYHRELALYAPDLLGFVQDTQPKEWQKFCANYPKEPEQKFLEIVAKQLNRADPNATHKESRTIRDKVGENAIVMKQIANNTPEQAMLGDFAKAIDNAIMDSSAAHQNQMLQLLSDPSKANKFARVVFDLLAMGKN